MRPLIYILLLSSIIFGAQCPVWDYTTDYNNNDCVYHKGKNYLGKHPNNKSNPPNVSLWWWEDCINQNVITQYCSNQYIDVLDTITIYDTITVFDTSYVVTFDTNYINIITHDTTIAVDTLSVIDTITLNDTVSVIDTITLNDTVSIFDTAYIDTAYIDTTPFYLDTLYDTNTVNLIVFDTINFFDTTRITDSLLSAIRDSLINDIKIPVIDSFTIVKLTKSNIRYIQDINLKDPLILKIDYEQNEVSSDLPVKIHVNIYVFDTMGQFVDKISISRDINRSDNTNNKLIIKEQFIIGSIENGRLVNSTGVAYASGIYIVRGIVNLDVNNKTTTINVDDTKYGYRREF